MYNSRFLIGLGGNLSSSAGPADRALVAALQGLLAEGVSICAVSRFYRSPAFPAGSGPDYVNACAEILGPDDPKAVLALLHRVETAMGRVRDVRWGPRVIDLDLLAAGDRVCPDADGQGYWRTLPLAQQRQQAPDRLILPHPRLADRAFVLIPLAEIAPLWRHPLTGATVLQMCDRLKQAEKAALKPFSAPFGGRGGL